MEPLDSGAQIRFPADAGPVLNGISDLIDIVAAYANIIASAQRHEQPVELWVWAAAQSPTIALHEVRPAEPAYNADVPQTEPPISAWRVETALNSLAVDMEGNAGKRPEQPRPDAWADDVYNIFIDEVNTCEEALKEAVQGAYELLETASEKKLDGYAHKVHSVCRAVIALYELISLYRGEGNVEPGQFVEGIVVESTKRVVMSGFALGCDGIAHAETISAGRKTVAVLPSAIDVVTPAAHRDLARRIVDTGGCLVSEYEPQASSSRHSNIVRDAIIAALAKVIFGIQCAVKSGTMHTVRTAHEMKRPLACYYSNNADSKLHAGNEVMMHDMDAKAIKDANALCSFLAQTK